MLSGRQPKKLPTPQEGSRMLPETKPMLPPEQLSILGHPEPETPVLEPVQARQEAPARPVPAPYNFRITDDDLGVGGPKAKYAANIAAIPRAS